MIIRHKIGGFYVNPIDRKNISLQINHDQDSVINQGAPHVGVNNLRLAREDVRKILSLLNQAPGITEGVPYDYEITERGVTQTISLYVDFMEGLAVSRDGVQLSVKMLQSLDWLDDKADGFTFESMYNETGVAPFTVDGIRYNSYQEFFDKRCIYIPYVISSVPNWQDAFMALFGIAYISNELYKVFKQITQWASPSAGLGATVHPAQIAIEVAYSVLLLATLISLLDQLIKCLIQPVKYHGGMLMSDLLKITAVKLGLQAQSSIWDVYPYNQMAYLPEKFNTIEGSASSFNILGNFVGGFGGKGYTISDVNAQASRKAVAHTSETIGILKGYFDGTGGDFLRFIKSICNGKIIIPDQTNTLVLERKDYYPPNTPYQLPNLRQDWNGYNTDELFANFILRFQSDLNDKNCIDFFDKNGNPFYPGTILQASHTQITTTNISLVGLKGVREINIQAARGAMKDRLNFVEVAVGALETVWHIIENIFIAIVNALIIALNIIIFVINIVIAVWNTIIEALHAVTSIINVIIDVVNAIPFVDVPKIPIFDNGKGKIGKIDPIDPISFVTIQSNIFTNRVNALLLENDNVNVPKLLLVDTSRTEFQGTRRIAYLHNDNRTTIHAKNLWDKFYFIEAFTGSQHNRFTKMSPALNGPDEPNRCILSLADFRNLVSNPQFKDNWGETVIADSIQWFPEQNGLAEFSFRKSGWLSNPQSSDGAKRNQEIAINLNLKLSVPNGQ